jgi:hypothetical protein
MSESSTITEADILQDVVSPDAAGLDPPAARSILDLKFNDKATLRMRTLLDRNNKGQLSEVEADELDKWRRVGMFLDLMQSKARLSLKEAQS